MRAMLRLSASNSCFFPKEDRFRSPCFKCPDLSGDVKFFGFLHSFPSTTRVARNGLCLSHLLGEYGEHSCIDLQKGGAPWKDKYNRNCDDYVRMQDLAGQTASRNHVERVDVRFLLESPMQALHWAFAVPKIGS